MRSRCRHCRKKIGRQFDTVSVNCCEWVGTFVPPAVTVTIYAVRFSVDNCAFEFEPPKAQPNKQKHPAATMSSRNERNFTPTRPACFFALARHKIAATSHNQSNESLAGTCGKRN